MVVRSKMIEDRSADPQLSETLEHRSRTVKVLLYRSDQADRTCADQLVEFRVVRQPPRDTTRFLHHQPVELCGHLVDLARLNRFRLRPVDIFAADALCNAARWLTRFGLINSTS